MIPAPSNRIQSTRAASQICLALAFSIACALPVAAGAEESTGWAAWWNHEEPESAPGVYLALAGSVGIGTGLDDHVQITSFFDGATRVPPTPAQRSASALSVDPGVGLHARAGYRIHPRFSVEAHFEWISEWSIGGTNSARTQGDVQSDVARAESWITTANLKLHLMTGRVQPYVVAGVGVMRLQAENRTPVIIRNNGRPVFEFNIDNTRATDFAYRAGAGVDIYFNERLSLVLGGSYVIPEGQLDPFDYVSVEWGLQYRF